MQNKPISGALASQGDFAQQLGQMAAFNGKAMGAFAQSCQVYASGFATLNKEFMGFVNTRLNHDANQPAG